jgi:CDP-diacylglycerol--serine O-phosphatidyltransferase
MAPGSSKYFVGMPTPAAAAVIAAVVHGLRLGGPMSIGPLQNGWWAIGWFILTAALGGLMTSTIRFYSFKDIPWARKQTSLAIVLVCLLAGVIWRYSEYTLMIIACTYTLVGVTLHLIRFFRHRLVSRTA